jgi:hypothetical protein
MHGKCIKIKEKKSYSCILYTSSPTLYASNTTLVFQESDFTHAFGNLLNHPQPVHSRVQAEDDLLQAQTCSCTEVSKEKCCILRHMAAHRN